MTYRAGLLLLLLMSSGTVVAQTAAQATAPNAWGSLVSGAGDAVWSVTDRATAQEAAADAMAACREADGAQCTALITFARQFVGMGRAGDGKLYWAGGQPSLVRSKVRQYCAAQGMRCEAVKIFKADSLMSLGRASKTLVVAGK